MKKLITLTMVLWLTLFTASASVADKDQVRSNYQDFKAALNSGNGQRACRYVTQNVFDFYDEARESALYDQPNEIEKETPIEVLAIFQLRYLSSKKELKGMSDGKYIFAWGVDNGLVNKEVINTFSLDKIQIEGNTAVASILKNDVPVAGIEFNFVNKDDIWKFDLLKLFSTPNAALENARKKAKKSKIELAMYIMAETYGEPIPPAILNGPLK